MSSASTPTPLVIPPCANQERVSSAWKLRDWVFTGVLTSCQAWSKPANGFKRFYTGSIWAYVAWICREPSLNKSWAEDEISSLVSCSLQLFWGDLGLSMAFFKPSQKPNLKYLNMLASWCFSSRGYGSISMWQHLVNSTQRALLEERGKASCMISGLVGEPQGLPLEGSDLFLKCYCDEVAPFCRTHLLALMYLDLPLILGVLAGASRCCTCLWKERAASGTAGSSTPYNFRS